MNNRKLKDSSQLFVRENISKGGAGFGLEQQEGGTRGGHAAAGKPIRLPAGKAASSTFCVPLRDDSGSHVNIHRQTLCFPLSAV